MSGIEIRISDAEREAAVSALGEHYAAGRLTREEYDERSTHALSAKTNSDLLPLFTDLPSAHSHQPPSPHGRQSQAPAAPRSSGQPPWYARGRWGRLPLLPILVVVGVLLVFTHVPWPLFLLLGWCWWTGMFRRGRTHQR